MPNASLAYYSPEKEKGRTVGYTIDVATSLFEKIRGRMFTESIDTDYALIFPFRKSRDVNLHMMFVPYDLGAIWVEDNVIQKTTIMSGWTGRGEGSGDVVIEVHPDVIKQVSEGDIIYLQGEHSVEQLERPDSVPTEPQY